jgi:hypothetical protein
LEVYLKDFSSHAVRSKDSVQYRRERGLRINDGAQLRPRHHRIIKGSANLPWAFREPARAAGLDLSAALRQASGGLVTELSLAT